MQPKSHAPRKHAAADNVSGALQWQIPPDKIERALSLHRAGKTANFIYLALWDSPPVSQPTFNRALATMLAELERAKLLAQIASLERGDVSGAVGLALQGKGSLPPDVEDIRNRMVGVFGRLEKRFHREMDADCGVKDATSLNKSLCETAVVVLKIERFRLETAILTSNLAVQAQEVAAQFGRDPGNPNCPGNGLGQSPGGPAPSPSTPGQPAVQIDLGGN